MFTSGKQNIRTGQHNSLISNKNSWNSHQTVSLATLQENYKLFHWPRLYKTINRFTGDVMIKIKTVSVATLRKKNPQNKQKQTEIKLCTHMVAPQDL